MNRHAEDQSASISQNSATGSALFRTKRRIKSIHFQEFVAKWHNMRERLGKKQAFPVSELLKQAQKAARRMPVSVREDAVQEFALGALRVIPQVRDERTALAFLACAGRRALMVAFQRRHLKSGWLGQERVFLADLLIPDSEKPVQFPDRHAPSPADEADVAPIRSAIQTALSQLSPYHRALVVSVFWKGESQARIARRRHVTQAAIYHALAHALAQLRTLLEPRLSRGDDHNGDRFDAARPFRSAASPAPSRSGGTRTSSRPGRPLGRSGDAKGRKR